MDENTRVITTDEELKIFSDPYRIKIIKTYQKYDVPLTVKQCADYMGEVPAKVHYHVKKLKSINVLELDHVEIINGINAKYYYLPQTGFTVKLLDENSELKYKQLNTVESIMANTFDDFRKDFSIATKKVIDSKTLAPTEVGIVSGDYVYLSKDDYYELIEKVTELIKQHSTKDKNKKRYSFLAGLAKSE